MVTTLWGCNFLNSKRVHPHLVAARLLVSTAIEVARLLVLKAATELARLLRADDAKTPQPYHRASRELFFNKCFLDSCKLLVNFWSSGKVDFNKFAYVFSYFYRRLVYYLPIATITTYHKCGALKPCTYIILVLETRSLK